MCSFYCCFSCLLYFSFIRSVINYVTAQAATKISIFHLVMSSHLLSWMSWAHCGVALLEIQLSPAGRDWVLLVTFSRAIKLERRLRWRWESQRSACCCWRLNGETSMSLSMTPLPVENLVFVLVGFFSVAATTLRSPWKMVRVVCFKFGCLSRVYLEKHVHGLVACSLKSFVHLLSCKCFLGVQFVWHR